MAKTFDELKALAVTVYEQARDVDRDHAVLIIVENLSRVYSAGQFETLNAVEERLSKR